MLAIFLRNRLRQGGISLWRVGGVLGVVLCAAYAFQTIGLRTTTATRAGFISGLFVVIVPLLSAFLLATAPDQFVVICIPGCVRPGPDVAAG